MTAAFDAPGFYNWLVRNSNWRRTLVLFAGCVGCFVAFQFRGAVMDLGASPTAIAQDKNGPDGRREGYSPDELRRYFDAIGCHGRELYFVTQLSLDVLFPLLYGLLFCDAVVRLCPGRFGRILVWVPVVQVAADLGENVLLAFLARGATDWWDERARLADALTRLKWAALDVTKYGLIAGAVVCLGLCAANCYRKRRLTKQTLPGAGRE